MALMAPMAPTVLTALAARNPRAWARAQAVSRHIRVIAGMAFLLVLGVAPGASGDGGPVECRLATGPYQLQVEKYLGLPEDGKQSAADCAAIQHMQLEYEIDPADGYAGLVSYRAALVDWAATHKASLTGCPDRPELVVCIDQAQQLLWLQKSGKITFGPVPARTGMPRHRTRNGWHRIYKRVQKFWSSLYDGPMPYSQFFDGGQALHASYRPIFEDPGSHGCVNLRYEDAKALWPVLRLGDRVYIWGTRHSA